jgi:hypothetical protein
MKVARHEVPGNVPHENRPVRVRYDRGTRGRAFITQTRICSTTRDSRIAKTNDANRRCTRPRITNDHTVPYGTAHSGPQTRHFMPGYLSLSPYGTKETADQTLTANLNDGARDLPLGRPRCLSYSYPSSFYTSPSLTSRR